jgi:hypothetical protein
MSKIDIPDMDRSRKEICQVKFQARWKVLIDEKVNR